MKSSLKTLLIKLVVLISMSAVFTYTFDSLDIASFFYGVLTMVALRMIDLHEEIKGGELNG